MHDGGTQDIPVYKEKREEYYACLLRINIISLSFSPSHLVLLLLLLLLLRLNPLFFFLSFQPLIIINFYLVLTILQKISQMPNTRVS